MRVFLTTIVMFVGTLAIDTFTFDGHYRVVAWQMAKYHGERFDYEVRHFVKNLGL